MAISGGPGTPTLGTPSSPTEPSMPGSAPSSRRPSDAGIKRALEAGEQPEAKRPDTEDEKEIGSVMMTDEKNMVSPGEGDRLLLPQPTGLPPPAPREERLLREEVEESVGGVAQEPDGGREDGVRRGRP